MRTNKTTMTHLEDFLEGKGISLEGWLYLDSLCKTVISRYFWQYADDLQSLALVDVAEFILNVLSTNEDRPKNLRNVLYTRIRNTCCNSVYHNTHIEAQSTEDKVLDLERSRHNADDILSTLDLDYNFETVEQARLLSLKVWDTYNRC